MGELTAIGRKYYGSRAAEILALFDEHARAWRPFLVDRYGRELSDILLREARAKAEGLIPEIPYIGGDGNPMTRHLVNSTTSLALYKAMTARGKTARETGGVIYDAVVGVIQGLPFSPAEPPPADFIQEKKAQAQESQERRYPRDWVWDFVEGDAAFDYGYDFYECGVRKYYRAQGAEEFLPYFCLLDFVTIRRFGQVLVRTTTLATGGEKCDFRFRSASADDEWPPPFPDEGCEPG